ncbi:MAG: PilW family protein [Gammaproteobacteria bacterium]|nr:PilW family protein [Gammaproteobacteria bacterium]NNJ79727.1 prepilin-type N-terminal cleavage/methylation domain-containing protein [Xanthomonadales bacterium]
MNAAHRASEQRGLTLMELLVAMAISAVLLLGLVKMFTALGSAARLQENQAILQDRERFAARFLNEAIASAGFSPQPWQSSPARRAVTPETTDHLTGSSDRLVVQTWSDRNCFDNLNPDRDGHDRPLYYLRITAFDLNGRKYLTRSCRYGPSPASLVLQVRRQGLLAGVESFQTLFGLDTDEDGNVERWVRGGGWSEEGNIRAVRIGLLLAGPDPVGEKTRRDFRVLDTLRTALPDGRLRRKTELTFAIRSRRS